MEIKGMPKVTAALRRLADRYPRAAAAALYQEGFEVWRVAVKRAPVKHGVLRGSAYVAPPTERGRAAVVEVGFGTVYARRQHEETTWNHPRGGEAKYLANALTALRGGMLARLARRIRENAERGIGVGTLPAPTAPALGWAGLQHLRRKHLPAAAARRMRAASRRLGRTKRRR